MAFKPPVNAPLTENQSKALSKFSAMRTFLSSSSKADKNIPKNQQISTYDFLTQMAYSVIGPGIIDILLKSFFDKLFDERNDKLEKMILKSVASSLDKSDKKISNNKTNEQWLMDNVLPGFKLAKRTLSLMIIAMIFGPKNKMDEYVDKSNTTGDSVAKKRTILDSAICSCQVFSLSNNLSEPQGDLEYNKVQLKKQLEDGNIEFVISCQNVKIKLPDNTENVLKSNAVSNPADIFSNLNNYVSQEITKQNTQENSNAINKSFLQTMNEKIFTLMPTAVSMQMDYVFDKIYSENPSINANIETVVSSPCEIVNICYEKDSENYKKKTAFSSTLINIMYALLISILFSELTNKIKKIIKQALAQRAKRKREKFIEKQKQRFAFLDKAGKAIGQSKVIKGALKSVDEIYDFLKDI